MSDVEKIMGDYAQLTNHNIRSFLWRGVSVSVKDRQTHEDKPILNNVSGIVYAGELMAVMGPSGSGKSTLLNVLANRVPAKGAHAQSDVFLNGRPAEAETMRKISCYVEQEDALVGSLTVRETLLFAARLSLPKSIGANERIARVEALINSFGLNGQANTLVGTPIRKGISGGQKRRVSVANQLITSPKILFLDEPTSGLDSAAAFEVIAFVKEVAKKHNLMVISSIHQPSTSTFAMFDKLLLLSHGNTAYSGPVKDVQSFFDSCGFPIPLYMNPAEFIIDFVNTDFAHNRSELVNQLEMVTGTWQRSGLHAEKMNTINREILHGDPSPQETNDNEQIGAHWFAIVIALIHRNFIKSYRDIIAYGIRIAMYMGLAVMMGTVWLRLDASQDNLQAFTNAIFFGGAFMSFMAVAYIPAYLEDRAIFMKERANGLYGPTSFLVSNFLTGLPYLFIITLLFSVVVYWLSNFRGTAGGFWMWVLWLFLDLVAAESLVVFITSVMPIFVVALAATAFANGLWMCTMGFMVRPADLNPFWRYVFHYIDYQSYVFEGMMVNEFAYRNYSCPTDANGNFACAYKSPLNEQGLIPGTALLDTYGYKAGKTGEYIGILIAIVVVYRALGWFVLYVRRT